MGLKIEFRTVGAVGSYSLLADVTAGDVVEDFAPDASVTSVQKSPLAQAVGQLGAEYRAPLGNVVTKLTFKLVQTSASETAASASARALTLALLGAQVNLKVTKGAGTPLDAEFYPNAVFSRCAHRNLGATIEYQLACETDLVTGTEPA